MKPTRMDPLEKIQKGYADFSKRQKKIADYIAGNGVEVSFDSIIQLAGKIGVSPPSIVRFAQLLGYKGYPQFRKELQEEFKKGIGSAARLRRAVTGVSHRRAFDVLLRKDIELIEETRNAVSENDFSKAVDLIWRARRVMVIGFRSAFSLAYFLSFRFARVGIDARLAILTGGTSLIEQLTLFSHRDLLVVIGFEYTPRETRTALEYAAKYRVPVLGITHLRTSEIARKADVCLLFRRQTRITQSLAAPMALLNAMAIEVANRRKAKALRALRRLDAFEAHIQEKSL